MATLYGAFRSRASRPIWLLYELDETFEHVPVIQAYRLKDAKAADAPFNTASPAFLKVNPIGQIPRRRLGCGPHASDADDVFRARAAAHFLPATPQLRHKINPLPQHQGTNPLWPA